MSEFIIYADFESCLKPVEKHDKMSGKLYIVNDHVLQHFAPILFQNLHCIEQILLYTWRRTL
jgi:hypothetical protein